MNSLIKSVWTNSISRSFGKFASKEFPHFFQVVVNKAYVKITGVDLSNFHHADQYESLNALFTRPLLYKRKMPTDTKSVISPADSLISELGEIKDNTALQIKGFDYNIEELLTKHVDKEYIERLEGGKFINFYLSPKDYHRYHTPMDMLVDRAIHVPGLLYPVNFKYLKKVPSLFVENERVVLQCHDEISDQLFFIILVGALNVGKMTLTFDERIETNIETKEINVYEYDNQPLKRGDELGMFKMGSTIVMLFEKDFVDLVANANEKIRFADVIADKV